MTTSIFLVHGILYSNGASFSRLRIFLIVILSTLQQITRNRIKNIFCSTAFYLSQIFLPSQTSLYKQGCLFQCFMKSLESKFPVILLPCFFCHFLCEIPNNTYLFFSRLVYGHGDLWPLKTTRFAICLNSLV